jgi:hypothetical protein
MRNEPAKNKGRRDLFERLTGSPALPVLSRKTHLRSVARTPGGIEDVEQACFRKKRRSLLLCERFPSDP